MPWGRDARPTSVCMECNDGVVAITQVARIVGGPSWPVVRAIPIREGRSTCPAKVRILKGGEENVRQVG